MSFDAIRWALEQPVKPSATKFVLVAMANCVNAEAGEMLCWASYKHLSECTSQDRKTVEAGVYRLKEQGFIVDTGKRKGETGKVVVYRLNTPKSGAVTPGPQAPSEGDRANPNAPETGVIEASGNDPEFPSNPPKNGQQSPQISAPMTPKTGYGTSNGTKKRTRKEPGRVITSLPDVPPAVFTDWMTARKGKALTLTALNAVEREAAKAGLTLAEAVTACAEFEWRGFNAGWYANRVGNNNPNRPGAKLNAQEALEESNRAVVARMLENDRATH